MISRLSSSKLQTSSCGLQRGMNEGSKYPASPRGSIKVTAARSQWEWLEDSVESKCLQENCSGVRLAICRTRGQVCVSEFPEGVSSDLERFNPYGVTRTVLKVTAGFAERTLVKTRVHEIVRQQTSWAMEKASQTDAGCRGPSRLAHIPCDSPSWARGPQPSSSHGALIS